MDRFSIIKKKKNIYIHDGIIQYQIKQNDKSLICCCDKFTQDTLCKHLHYYLSNKGFDLKHMKHWNKIKHIIFSHLTKTDENINNDDVLDFINKNILNVECGFCLEKINVPEYHICSKCSNISHIKCAQKWINKGCMYCRD